VDVELKEYEDGWYVGSLSDRNLRSADPHVCTVQYIQPSGCENVLLTPILQEGERHLLLPERRQTDRGVEQGPAQRGGGLPVQKRRQVILLRVPTYTDTSSNFVPSGFATEVCKVDKSVVPCYYGPSCTVYCLLPKTSQ
jgi:hypothetical protein